MHHKLFESQDGLDRDVVVRLAKEIGLDEKRFVADLDAKR